jgi:hypothetical protein
MPTAGKRRRPHGRPTVRAAPKPLRLEWRFWRSRKAHLLLVGNREFPKYDMAERCAPESAQSGHS